MCAGLVFLASAAAFSDSNHFYPTSSISTKQFTPDKSLNQYWMFMDSTITTSNGSFETADHGYVGAGSWVQINGTSNFKTPTRIKGTIQGGYRANFFDTLLANSDIDLSSQGAVFYSKGLLSVGGNLSLANPSWDSVRTWVAGNSVLSQNVTYTMPYYAKGKVTFKDQPILNYGPLYLSGDSTSLTGKANAARGGAISYNQPFSPPVAFPSLFAGSQMPGYNIAGLDDATVAALGPRTDVGRFYAVTTCDGTNILCDTVPAHTMNGVSLAAGRKLPPGYYDTLTGDGNVIYLGEGVYYFDKVTLQNNAMLVAIQPTGGRTIIYARNGFTTSSGGIFVGPDSAVGATGYGSGPKLFLGGTMMIVSGPGANIQLDSDTRIWATLSAPTGRVLVNSQLYLYGQMFGRHFNGANTSNNFSGAAGEFIPFDPDIPTINISISPAGTTVPEADSTYFATITLSHRNAYAVSFKYSTATSVATSVGTWVGTAVAGTNFVSRADSVVVIKAGDTSVTIPFRIKWDTAVTGNLNFYLNFTEPAGGKFGLGSGTVGDSTHVAALITIVDKDRPPALRVRDSAVFEGNSGNTRLSFIVSFVDSATGGIYRGKLGRAILFNWSTSDSTAQVADSDYIPVASRTDSIARGATADTINVTVKGDLRYEPTEYLKVALDSSSLVGKVATTSPYMRLRAVGTILNDDSLPQLKIDNAGWPEGDSGRTLRKFVVYMVNPVNGARLDSSSAPRVPVKFGWSTSDGTAGSSLSGAAKDTDFVAVPYSVRTISAGRWTDTLAVQYIGDRRYEPDETFSIAVVPLDSAKKVAATAVDTIRNDDNQPLVRLFGGAVAEGRRGDRNVASFRVRLYSQATGDSLPLSNAPTLPVSFDWYTVDSTAVGMAAGSSDSDYLPVKIHRDTVYPGSVSKTLSVAIVGDNRYEPTEYFSIRLANFRNAAAAPAQNDTMAVMAIVNDDSLPRLAVSSDSNVHEGGPGDRRAATFTATLVDAAGSPLSAADAPEVPVSFSWQTSDGTAKASGSGVADTDYVASGPSLVTMQPGTLSTKLSATVKGDAVYEGDETFGVSLSPAANLSATGRFTAQTTIVDDDAIPTLALTGVRKLEGNAGVTTFGFGATITVPSAIPVVFKWWTADSTAKVSDGDYQMVDSSRTFTIPAGRTDTILPVFVNGDNKLEDDEIFFVRSRIVSGARIASGRDSVWGVILNDDGKPHIQVLNAVKVVDERTPPAVGDTLRFPVVFVDSNGTQITSPIGIDISYSWSTFDSVDVVGFTGASSADNDFVRQPPATRTIRAGAVLLDTLKVAVIPDAKHENDESFRVSVQGVVNADTTSRARTSAFGTIHDDDAAPTVTVVDDTVQEPAQFSDGDSLLNFVFRLSASSALPVAVPFQTEAVTATPDQASGRWDYRDTAGTLVFAPGTTTLQVQVRVHGDSIFEGTIPEKVRMRILTGGVTNASVLRDTAIGYIRDNDAVPVLHVDTAAVVGEGGSSVFTVSLRDSSGGRVVSGVPVSFKWSTLDGTAKAAEGDYRAVSLVPDTIPALTGSVTVSVATLADNLSNEGVESFLVVLSNPVNAALGDTGLGRIADATPKPVVSINDTVVREDSLRAVFTIRLDRPSSVPLVLRWGTATDTLRATLVRARASGTDSNYTPQSGKTLTIPAGSVTATVLVPIVHALVDDPDTLWYFTRIFHQGTAADSAYRLASDSLGEGGILDVDPPPSITIADTSVREPQDASSSAVWVKFRVSLSSRSGRDVSVGWTTVDSTAKHDSDYVAKGGTLTIKAGQTSVRDSVRILADSIWEGVEYFKIKLSGPSNATISRSTGVVAVYDNDSSPLVRVSDASIVEPDTSSGGQPDSSQIAFKISLSHISGVPVLLSWKTLDSTAKHDSDFRAVAPTPVTINAGDSIAFVKVWVYSDLIAEPTEYFKVLLAKFTAGDTNFRIADSVGVGTIKDANRRPSIKVNDTSVVEADTNLVFTLSLKGSSSTAIKVFLHTEDVTATAPDDYLRVRSTGGDTSITIPAFATSATFPVRIKSDLLHENNETFRLVITGTDSLTGAADTMPDGTRKPSANVTSPGYGVGTILDNDPPPSFTAYDTAMKEPASIGSSSMMRFRVHLSAPSGLPVSVSWHTADSSAQTVVQPYDYVDTASSLMMRPGLTDTTISVRILGDSLYEATERFKIVFDTIDGATFARRLAIGTITDNDTAPRISIDSQTVSEGETALFTLRISRPSGLPVTFSWRSFQIGTAAGFATPGLDYKDTSGTATIPAGSIFARIAVRTLADFVSGEGRERFQVRISNLVGATGDSIGLGTILDTNSLPFLSIDSVLGIRESDTLVHFTVRLAGAPGAGPIQIRYSTRPGTATPGLRYADTSGVAVIPAGGDSVRIAVHILNDSIREPDIETFLLVLDSADSARIRQPIGLGSIVDDGDFPVLVVLDADTVLEGDHAVFPARVRGATKDTVRFWWHTVDGTAKAGSDFPFASGSVTFIPGSVQASISLATTADNVWEPTESFHVRIDSARGVSGLATPTDSLATAWIRDLGGVPTVSFLGPDTMVHENSSDSVPVRVGLSRPASVDVKVLVPRVQGTATYGADYTVSGLHDDTLLFKAGDTVAVFKVHVVVDSLDEDDEFVLWGLHPFDPIGLGGMTRHRLTILDDDSAPSVGFQDTLQKVVEGDSVVVVAKLSRPSAKDVQAWYRTSGTALSSGRTDLRSDAHEVLLFPAGSTTARFTIHTRDDNVRQGTQYALLRIDSLVNGRVDSARIRDSVVVLDNDSVPQARFAVADTSFREDAGTVRVRLLLDHPSATPIRLRIAAHSGTATLDSLKQGSDAVLADSASTGVTYIVEVPALDTAVQFPFRIADDGRVEPTEFFRFTLTSGDSKVALPDSMRIAIIDQDTLPSIHIVRPVDSSRTREPRQPVDWNFQGVPQPSSDTVLASGWNRIIRTATDTAGNTVSDTVWEWGDFTPPAVHVFKITGRNPHVPARDTTWWGDLARTRFGVDTVWYWVRDSIQAPDGRSWRVLVDTHFVVTDLHGDSLFPVPVSSCDSLGNCGRDTGWISLKQSTPVVDIRTPPSGSNVMVGEVPVVYSVKDGGKDWTSTGSEVITQPGGHDIVRCFTDDVGNTGCDTNRVSVKPVEVQTSYYIDTDGDGRADAAVVVLESKWTASTWPSFNFVFNDSVRSGQTPDSTHPFYTGPSRGTPVVVNGDTIWVAAGAYLTDSAGHPLMGPDGKPLTSILGDTAKAADGSILRDSLGRVLYVMTSTGTPDPTRFIVPIHPPFAFGQTGFAADQPASMDIIWTTTDSVGNKTKHTYVDSFGVGEKVAPVILSAVIHRTESYTAPDTLVIHPSEPLDLSGGKDWLEVWRCGSGKASCDSSQMTWVKVPADSVHVRSDGTYWFLVQPGESGSIRPSYKVRFLQGVSDTGGNATDPSKIHWSTSVTGAPRPDLVDVTPPAGVAIVPPSESHRTTPGVILFKATKGKSNGTGSNFQWWAPGQGYSVDVSKVRDACPQDDWCNGPTLYINRPAKMIIYIYDLMGSFVTSQQAMITQADIDAMEPDQLDRVSVKLEWNHRTRAGQLVATGVYVWRIVSWVEVDGKPMPVMTNKLVKAGVKIHQQ